mmetsp:Transcript_62772/g.104487  ORF Transcript_62772/g.104487 Transcript_62772/m.104487 type:complete len:273 (+) Transcript_62772:62-880(+)
MGSEAQTTPADAPHVTCESSMEASDAEQLLWTCAECFVYQIPPLKNESGHRANDWDVNKWLWSGKLMVVALGTTVEVRLLDSTSGDLFACCPVTAPNSKAIDPVVDSSRYFVLRIDDGKGRHAFIGMGFRDRSDSYDFNATLQDHWKGVQRQREADEMRQQLQALPVRDLSLKDGQTLNIKVNVPTKVDGRPSRIRANGGEGLKLPLPPPPSGTLLAPPPPNAPIRPPTAQASATTSADDDFGVGFDDFQAASAGGNADDFADFGEFKGSTS